MKKQELIKAIMTEVEDTNLRNELLRQIVNNRSENDSLLNALSKLGINTTGAKEYVGFQLKVKVILGHVAGGLLLFGGAVMILVYLTQRYYGAVMVSAFCAVMGWYALVSAQKLSRALKPATPAQQCAAGSQDPLCFSSSVERPSGSSGHPASVRED
jgi:hypothetical protein